MSCPSPCFWASWAPDQQCHGRLWNRVGPSSELHPLLLYPLTQRGFYIHAHPSTLSAHMSTHSCAPKHPFCAHVHTFLRTQPPESTYFFARIVEYHALYMQTRWTGSLRLHCLHFYTHTWYACSKRMLARVFVLPNYCLVPTNCSSANN